LVNVGTGGMFYFLNDMLGTPQMLTDASNTVVWEGVYKPFGEAEVNPNSSVVCNFRFPGQYYDQETGLHYNYHRYYDPATGRYLRPDPIGLLGGINLWTYSDLNPINSIDPDGLEPLVAPGPVPLPIIPPSTVQQQAASQDIANAIWGSWQKYVDPALRASGGFLYEGGLGIWLYDKLNSPKPVPDYVGNKQKFKESRLPAELKYGGSCEKGPGPEKDPCKRLEKFIQSPKFKKLHPLKQFITIQMYTWGCR